MEEGKVRRPPRFEEHARFIYLEEVWSECSAHGLDVRIWRLWKDKLWLRSAVVDRNGSDRVKEGSGEAKDKVAVGTRRPKVLPEKPRGEQACS